MMKPNRRTIRWVALLVIGAIGALCVLSTTASAQQMEPRAFSPAPVGLNIVFIGYAYSTGSLLFDQSVPIEDATADVNVITPLYVRSINFFGMSGKVAAFAPFFIGDWQGKLNGEPAATSRSAFGDPTARLAVSFLGAPALALREFAGYRQKTILGAGLDVVIPVGEYDPDKIINLGSNRWSLRTSVGGSQALGKLTLELLADAWFFTENPESLNGATVKQDPILGLQGHAIYTFARWVWVGLDAGFGSGGQTKVNDVAKDNNQNSSRAGVTLGFTLGRRHGLKLSYVSAVSTRIGADLDILVAGYQYRWGGGI
jgi:hypothetical protein